MHRVGRWLDRSRATVNASTQSLDSLAESQNLESAMKAVELILDDDIQGAERGLESGNSAFHKLAKGTLAFIRATLGFEQEVMKEASEQLSEAESSAYANYNKSQTSTRAYSSDIYQRGTEFVLCQAEAQLMQAVVGVLNESLTESLKGFYKLRKAYMALETIVQMETDFMRAKGVKSLESSTRQSTEDARGRATPNQLPMPTSGFTQLQASAPHHSSGLRNAEASSDAVDADDDEDDFYEAEEIQEHNPVTKEYSGRVDVLTDAPIDTVRNGLPKLNITDGTLPGSGSDTPRTLEGFDDGLTEDADSYVFANSLDAFIHSGANLCFGLLSVMISIIPPAFSRLLSIIGFRGNRDRGLRGLWQATKFTNINGGMAALCLFGFYNGLTGFCDVLPDADPNDLDNVDGYPFQRLANLLAVMRKAYPKSHLWLIEEARMASTRRDIPTALEVLSSPRKAQLKQLQSFHLFEKGLDSLHSHNYKLCAESFIACCDLNSWSQALYYYIAGAAYLELYRHQALDSNNSALAQQYRKQALEYFNIAPTKVGKRKMMGRQLPFDYFVTRKIAKWTARAEARGCDMIDAIGVSPGEEMILLWNGFKKQNGAMLEDSLRNLAWSERQPHWNTEDIDEKGILAVLKAVIFRNMGKHEESKATLRDGVLSHPATAFKGHKDDWPPPLAHYEMAVNLWMQRTGYQELKQRLGSGYGSPLQDGERKVIEVDLAGDARLVAEAKGWAEKAKGWESYTLDARFGLRVTSCLDAIKKWEQKHGAVAAR